MLGPTILPGSFLSAACHTPPEREQTPLRALKHVRQCRTHPNRSYCAVPDRQPRGVGDRAATSATWPEPVVGLVPNSPAGPRPGLRCHYLGDRLFPRRPVAVPTWPGGAHAGVVEVRRQCRAVRCHLIHIALDVRSASLHHGTVRARALAGLSAIVAHAERVEELRAEFRAAV